MPDGYDYLFKVALIGDSGVGKSCSLLRYVDDTYTESYISTIGVDFKIKVDDNRGKKIKLQIWDTAGQERFKDIGFEYARGAHALVIYFDITDQVSYNNVKVWIKESNRYARKGVPIIIVGNKCDLESKRQVTTETAQEFCDSIGVKYIETSAKNSVNVDEVFHTLTSEILAKEALETEQQAEEKVETGNRGDDTEVEEQGFFSRLFSRIGNFFRDIFNLIFRPSMIDVKVELSELPDDEESKTYKTSEIEAGYDSIEYSPIGTIYRNNKKGIYFTDRNGSRMFFSKEKYDNNVVKDGDKVKVTITHKS